MSLGVLHVVDSMSAEAGSIAISLRGLFAALAARDVRSDVLVAEPAGASGADTEKQGYVIHYADGASIRSLVAQCDLIHLHGWDGGATARTVAKAARARQKPYILSPLGGLCPNASAVKSWKQRICARFFDGGLIQAAAAITAVNDVEADHLTRERGLTPVTVLPYGLDFSTYQGDADPQSQAPPRADQRCLLLMAPLAPWAGQALLLKSFAEIGAGADGWHVLLAGSDRGHWRSPLEAAIRRKGGSDRVTFDEAPDEPAQRALMARASLIVAPSMHVGHCVSALQAMAGQVPVLVSDRIAPPALNGCVEVFPPTRNDLKRALRTYLGFSDGELRVRATRAHEAARNTYDWPHLVKRYHDLYRGLR